MNEKHAEYIDGLAELIDHFNTLTPEQLSKALQKALDRLDPSVTDCPNPREAYLAASAEYLARKFKLPIPAWTEKPEYFLREAWFENHGFHSLNALQIVGSPMTFRRRFIFTEDRPLRRALFILILSVVVFPSIDLKILNHFC